MSPRHRDPIHRRPRERVLASRPEPANEESIEDGSVRAGIARRYEMILDLTDVGGVNEFGERDHRAEHLVERQREKLGRAEGTKRGNDGHAVRRHVHPA
jgi:hypothetical protein